MTASLGGDFDNIIFLGIELSENQLYKNFIQASNDIVQKII